MLLNIGLYLGNEGVSVFPFVWQAEGTSWPPPDSHCFNLIMAVSTTVPSGAPR